MYNPTLHTFLNGASKQGYKYGKGTNMSGNLKQAISPAAYTRRRPVSMVTIRLSFDQALTLYRVNQTAGIAQAKQSVTANAKGEANSATIDAQSI